MRRVVLPGSAAAAAGTGLVVTWAAGGHTQVEGVLGAIALGAAAIALVGVARAAAPDTLDEERREPSLPEVPEERRRFLARILIAWLVAVGVASFVPLRRELRRTGRALKGTAWRQGSRLVTDDGRPVRVSDLAVGGLLTVYPEGRTDASDAQAVLIRLEPGRLIAEPGRRDWTPQDYVAYSKLCTHMGCPVGLYQQRTQVLLCPCHQASFDVLRGGRPILGPAARPLPQLPLEVDGDGYLRAGGDFAGDVGPGYWDRPS